MCIEGCTCFIYHPEDRLAALGPTEVIAIGSMMHIVNSQSPGINGWTEEIEVIATTGLYHCYGG